MNRKAEWLGLEMTFLLWVIISTDSFPRSSSPASPSAWLRPFPSIQSTVCLCAGERACPAIRPKDAVRFDFCLTNGRLNQAGNVKSKNPKLTEMQFFFSWGEIVLLLHCHFQRKLHKHSRYKCYPSEMLFGHYKCRGHLNRVERV